MDPLERLRDRARSKLLAGKETKAFIDEASRFQAFASRMEDMCRNRGVVPLSEIDELARKEGIRGPPLSTS